MTIICEKVYQIVRYITLTSHIKNKSMFLYEIKLYKITMYTSHITFIKSLKPQISYFCHDFMKEGLRVST